MCGFDTRGSIIEIHPDGSRTTRAITPQETVWLKFEEIFTNKYSDTKKDADYMKWLKKIKREDYPDQETKNYIRRWTLPLTQYGKHYDYCDVCLAPIDLVDVHTTDKGQVIKRVNLFNEVKSELKIIEAGMKKKCLIAQDFGIYKQLIKNGVTGILVSDNKDGWYKAMRKVIQEPEYREMLANNLHEYVKEKYELKNVTSDRASAYKEILANKKKSSIILNPADFEQVK
jgi:glycosyltransferase involved in cell wall biosynthesis